MNTKTDRRAQVRFSAAKFRRLPMDAKLSYLRSAFDSLRGGKSVIDLTVHPALPRNKMPQFGPQQPTYLRLLSTAGFERLPIEKKITYLQYLARAYRDLQKASRQLHTYFASSTTALPNSPAPALPAPELAKPAIRKPRGRRAHG